MTVIIGYRRYGIPEGEQERSLDKILPVLIDGQFETLRIILYEENEVEKVV